VSVPDDNVLDAVGERMAAFRTVCGLTLEDVCAETGMDIERIAEAEAGEIALGDAELQRLAEVYGIEVTALFGGRVTPISYLAGT
jgi:transcriptional regulator with XRE-family HTH domain